MSSLDSQLFQDRYGYPPPGRSVLRLRRPPPAPPMVRSRGMNFPISVPEPDPNYVWITNRDSLEGSWRPMNSPITEDQVGRTVFNQIGQDQTFQPEHHGMNVPAESRMSDDQLRGRLDEWRIPSQGNRQQLFERNLRVKHHPTFMQNYARGNRPNEAEVSDIMGGNQQMSLQEAARMRGLRRQAGYYQNVQPPAPAEPRPNGNMGSIAGLGRQQGNLAERIGPQANAARGAAAGEAAAGEGALAGGTAAGEAGMMGGAGMMAARAVPILNLVLLGKMLMDGVTASSKEAKQKQQALMYRT